MLRLGHVKMVSADAVTSDIIFPQLETIAMTCAPSETGYERVVLLRLASNSDPACCYDAFAQNTIRVLTHR
jgi:hypothetical protein